MDIAILNSRALGREGVGVIGKADRIGEEEVVGMIVTTPIHRRDEEDLASTHPLLLDIFVGTLVCYDTTKRSLHTGDVRHEGRMIKGDGWVPEGEVRLRKDTIVTLSHSLRTRF